MPPNNPGKETFANKCQDCGRTFRAPAILRQRRQHFCAELRSTMLAQNNWAETSVDEAHATRTQQRSQEKEKLGQTEMEAIEETRSSEPRKTNKKLTDEESAMERPENKHHVRGRQRQPGESGGNAKGALSYAAEAETWQCAQ